MALTTKTPSTQLEDVPRIPPTQAVDKSTVRSILAWQAHSDQGSNTITGGGTLESALDALRANRVRSFLTMLGVIMGISAVIAVVTLTQGVSKNVSDRFAGLGTNVLTIIPGTTSSTGARTAAGSNQTLTLADANALTQVSTIINVSPVINASEQVVYQSQNWNTSVRGVYPSYQTIQNWQLAEGSWFTDEDEQIKTSVAVLGQTVVDNLFPTGTDPIGQKIRVGGSGEFRIVGVLQSKGSQGPSNSDDVIFIPFSTANKALNSSTYVNQIQVQVDNINDITQAQQDITALLRTRHHLTGPDPSLQKQNSTNGQRNSTLGGGLAGGGGPQGGPPPGGGGPGGPGGGGPGGGGGGGGASGSGGSGQGGTSSTKNSSTTGAAANPANDFQIFNVNQIIQTAQQNSTILTILLIAIAAISLAVGGVGIMNIMLVSVTERVREIGIRMAIGARRRDIRNQFLAEAVTLSAIGGIIGILIGQVGGFALTAGLGLPFILSPIPALVAFTVSAAIGITFGLYPAARAARLDPIEALRTV